ncbi:MAG: RES domain-containing protein [Xanthomonadales bacterium]|nr:RES domain-containing protein [Xanthomonadales bacterium]
MTTTIYRLIKSKHLDQSFDGSAAKRLGGRWNHKGQACVYCAGTAALSFLEVLVHILNARQLKNYVLYQAAINTADIQTLNTKSLPARWRDVPAPHAIRSVGTEWLQSQSSLALRTPSAVIPVDHNYLINPNHHEFKRIQFKQVEFDLDPRMGLIGAQ